MAGMTDKPPHIYLIAGEASGDALGAQLMAALDRYFEGQVSFSGIGGPLMEGKGLKSLFPMQDLSVMGLAEVLPNLIKILRRISQTVEDIKKRRPDLVVTIDAPDFSFRVAKAVQKRVSDPPKLVHYVAPTVWAWRPGRAKKIARFLDGLICLFDFEPPYFEQEGLTSVAVGHPLVEGPALQADGRAFRVAHSISPGARTVGILFGSRAGEVKRLGPVLSAVMRKIVQAGDNIHFIVPTLPHIEDRVKDLAKNLNAPVHITTDPNEKWNAFAACDTAVAVSGTVGLELAAIGVPHVIAYKMNPLTWQIVKRLIRVRYAHLANIMLDRPVIPEFIQGDCKPDYIAAETLSLLTDEMHKDRQLSHLEQIRNRLGAEEKEKPSDRAAAFLSSVLFGS